MNQKGFIKDIVIIALGILILGVGYFYFSQKPAYAPSENSDTNQKVADETADWKTYTNEKYGFEFKYPTQYKLEEASNNVGLIREGVSAYFTVFFGEFNFGLEGTKKKGEKIYEISNDTVKADILIDDPEFNQGRGDGLTTIYTILSLKKYSNDFVIYVTYHGSQMADTVKEIDQIISTFKFTK